MRRTTLRTFLLAVVLVAAVGIAYQAWRSAQGSRTRVVEEVLREIIPDATQRIREFHRVKMKDGRPVWEVYAKEARYFEQDEHVLVDAPRVIIYFDEGARRAELSGTTGRLDLSTRDLDAVRLEGGVRLALDDLEFTTDVATYERTRDMVIAPGAVTITGRALAVEADGMEVELGPQRLRLLANVRTEMRIDAAES